MSGFKRRTCSTASSVGGFADDLEIRLCVENQVSGNHPTGTSPLFGGILVGSSRGFGGLDPSRNVVRSNRLSKNRPADLVYDGSGKGNRFVANTCRTSMPSGACR